MNLNGLRILNTRPRDQSLDLSQAIHDAGGVSIDLPALAIEPTADVWLKNLPDLTRTHHAIFISTNAVNYFFTAVSTEQFTWPRTIQTTAVGKATARALEKWGVHVDHIPPIANSEHLLQLESLKQVLNQTILWVKGEGGRIDIPHALRTRGAQLISLDVYRRVLPNKTPQHVYSLWHDDVVDIILLTSQQAMHNLFTLLGVEAHPWLRKTPCIVISERLAQEASRLGMQNIMVCRYDTILNTLAQRLR